MSREASKRPSPSAEAVFQGELGGIDLASILQMIGSSGKTGIFRLQKDGSRGDICLREGTVIHAEVEGLQGEEAFYELIVGWKQGEFCFLATPPKEKRTIQKGWAGLLMEASEREEEWLVLSKKIPSIHSIPVCEDWDAAARVSVTPQEKSLLYELDGRQTIEQIARSLGIGTFDLCKTLYGLLITGRVTLTEAESPH